VLFLCILSSQIWCIIIFLIFPGNLGMYDSWLSEQVADIPLQVQDGLGHSICVSMLLLERKTLTISQNPSLTMEDLHRSFKYLNTSYLKRIVLINNAWGIIPNGMFHSLSRIKHIDLTGNKLQILNCTECKSIVP
jgi:hypothetical protein